MSSTVVGKRQFLQQCALYDTLLTLKCSQQMTAGRYVQGKNTAYMIQVQNVYVDLDKRPAMNGLTQETHKIST